MNDTIVAISTALGEGAISIRRISGDDAIKIVNPLFDGKNLNEVDSHTINYGHIIYKGEIIDEVLLSIMKAPKTYTKEDVIEINTHGSIAVVNKIMEILLLETSNSFKTFSKILSSIITTCGFIISKT